jgi:hypothetical protein
MDEETPHQTTLRIQKEVKDLLEKADELLQIIEKRKGK